MTAQTVAGQAGTTTGSPAGPGPAGEARQPGLPDRVVRYGIWLAVVTLIKNNQARPVRRAIHWYSMEGQVRDAKELHPARQAVQPGKR